MKRHSSCKETPNLFRLFLVPVPLYRAQSCTGKPTSVFCLFKGALELLKRNNILKASFPSFLHPLMSLRSWLKQIPHPVVLVLQIGRFNGENMEPQREQYQRIHAAGPPALYTRRGPRCTEQQRRDILGLECKQKPQVLQVSVC